MCDRTIRTVHMRALKDFDTLLEEMFGCFHQIEEGTEDKLIIDQTEHLQDMIEKLREVLSMDASIMLLDTLKEVSKNEGLE